jgi:D-glycero-alpha-D-manno-heptose 1-phosphate guanylyltransferase
MSCEEAIILVGGLGTRLRSLVSDVPKPLAPVAGRPFLAWLLDKLEGHGVRRVILATGYLSEKVQAAFGEEWNGLRIDYSVEDEPLGTGGAIAKALILRSGDTMHVLNGDTFLDYRLQALAEATLGSGCAIGMALAAVPDVARYGAVMLDQGRVTAFLEKGQHGCGYINAGGYFLSADAIAHFPMSGAFSFEQTILKDRVAAGVVFGFTETAGFIDIGVPNDYMKAQAFIPRFA